MCGGGRSGEEEWVRERVGRGPRQLGRAESDAAFSRRRYFSRLAPSRRAPRSIPTPPITHNAACVKAADSIGRVNGVAGEVRRALRTPRMPVSIFPVPLRARKAGRMRGSPRAGPLGAFHSGRCPAAPTGGFDRGSKAPSVSEHAGPDRFWLAGGAGERAATPPQNTRATPVSLFFTHLERNLV